MYRNIHFLPRWLITTVVAMALGAVSAEASIVLDAQEEFNVGVQNPNVGNPYGTWSYGSLPAPTTGGNGPPGPGAFIPFDQYASDSVGFGWRPTNHVFGAPVVGRLLSAPYFPVLDDQSKSGLQVGDLILHGGQVNQFAVVRLTILIAGLYDIKAPWQPGDVSDAGLFLLRNGNVLEFTTTTATPGELNSLSVPLAVGDIIDLALGTSGNFNFDTTGVNLQLSLVNGNGAVPEVTSLLSFGGLITCSALFWRRRSESAT